MTEVAMNPQLSVVTLTVLTHITCINSVQLLFELYRTCFLVMVTHQDNV